MNFFHNVLAKAKEEGKIDPSLLPWEGQSSVAQDKQAEVVEIDSQAAARQLNVRSSSLSLGLPSGVVNDYQKIVENIRLAAEKTGAQIIGIAGPRPGEGVSTLATITAFIAAGPRRAGRKSSPDSRQGVLLIDAQVRLPALHTIFEIPNGPGFCEVFAGQGTLEDALYQIDDYQVEVMAAGNCEQFQFVKPDFQYFKQVLNNLRNRYEFIIVDLPPVLEYADGIALSRLCDGVVLVVGAGRTLREDIDKSKAQLGAAGIVLLGGVVNRQKSYIPKGILKRF